MNKLILLLLICMMLGCSYGKEASKGVGGEISDSFKKADEKENLLEARQRVIKSRNKYNSCLKHSPSGCEREKSEYDENVEAYVELQKQLSDL